MASAAGNGRKKILILGGGFGGVYTALYLQKALKRRDDIEVSLVNKENYFVFQPMLAEVISGSLGIFDPIVPIRHLCPRVNLYLGEVESIDLPAKEAVVRTGLRTQPHHLAFDHLVLALGTLENFSAVPGLAEHGVHFKNLGDALVLRNHLIHTMEAADVEQDEATRRRLLTFVMAGGGFSGVEAIAEVNDFVRGVAKRYPHIKPAEIKVVLIHSGPRILPEISEELSRYSQRLLDKRQVEIRLRSRLAAVTADEAILSDGARIPTKTLMATIGATPNPVLTELPCENDRGRVVVNEFLEVSDYPGVWALGDCARITDFKNKERCPPTAQYATREARCLAGNILATIDGKEKGKKPFAFSALGMMGSLGHRSAVGEVMGLKVSGLLAWFMWRAIYWAKLPGANRKFRVALDWSLDLILQKDLVFLNAAPTESVSREHFEPGETLFRQGEVGDRLYVIIDGEVDVVREDGSGHDTVVASLGKGDCLGEMALINDAPRNSTARTKTRVDAPPCAAAPSKNLFEYMPALRESFQRMVEERSRARRVARRPTASPVSKSDRLTERDARHGDGDRRLDGVAAGSARGKRRDGGSSDLQGGLADPLRVQGQHRRLRGEDHDRPGDSHPGHDRPRAPPAAPARLDDDREHPAFRGHLPAAGVHVADRQLRHLRGGHEGRVLSHLPLRHGHVCSGYAGSGERELAAKHYKNRFIQQEQCYTCHADYGVFGTMSAKFTGLFHLYHWLTSSQTALGLAQIHLYHPYQNTWCLHCHAGSKRFLEADGGTHLGLADQLVSVDPKTGAPRMSCLTCHGPIHPTVEQWKARKVAAKSRPAMS